MFIAVEVAAIVALIVWLYFGYAYDKYTWYRSPEGRNVMAMAISINVSLIALLAALFTPYLFISMAIGFVSLLGIATVGVWRTVQMKRAQKAYGNSLKRNSEEGK